MKQIFKTHGCGGVVRSQPSHTYNDQIKKLRPKIDDLNLSIDKYLMNRKTCGRIIGDRGMYHFPTKMGQVQNYVQEWQRYRLSLGQRSMSNVKHTNRQHRYQFVGLYPDRAIKVNKQDGKYYQKILLKDTYLLTETIAQSDVLYAHI